MRFGSIIRQTDGVSLSFFVTHMNKRRRVPPSITVGEMRLFFCKISRAHGAIKYKDMV